MRILTADESPRVWSLIATVFGDLAQAPGDRISGAVLMKIGQLAGIKPEAMRVALHRLRRDGWIESKRTGRQSEYGLTSHGRKESAAATPRIYNADDMTEADWTLLVAEPGKSVTDALPDLEAQTSAVVWVGGGAAIVKARSSPRNTHLLSLTGNDLIVPEWLKNQIIDKTLIQSAHRLVVMLRKLEQMYQGALDLDAMQIAVLRILIVHSWRRVRLRQPDLPDRFFPDNWPGPQCRSAVAQLLSALPRPQLKTLEKTAVSTRTSVSPSPVG